MFDNLPKAEPNLIEVGLEKAVSLLSPSRLFKGHEKEAKLGLNVLLAILYNVYFFGAVYYYTNNEDNDKGIEWCEGLGFLIILTVIVYACLFYFYIVKPLFRKALKSNQGQKIMEKHCIPILEHGKQMLAYKHSSIVINLVVIAVVVIFLVVDTADERRRLVSFFGLVTLICLATLFSHNISMIRWRQVMWGLALQFGFALFILRWDVGRQVFQCLGDKSTSFLAFTDEGSSMVYGYLSNQQPFALWALPENSTAYEVAKMINDNRAINFVFAFKVLSVIFFFSFFVNMLFYVGAMQWIIEKIGWMLQVTVGTTACESMNAAANIFVGMTEAPLIIKPFMPVMTNSELHCVMASGMATIAGSVLAAYISFNVSASHLLTASVMSAPAALAASKLLFPGKFLPLVKYP